MGKAVHLEKETRAITAATAGGDQEGLKAPAPTKAENPPVDPKGIGTSDPNSRAGQTLDLIGQNLAVGGGSDWDPLSLQTSNTPFLTGGHVQCFSMGTSLVARLIPHLDLVVHRHP